jgi:diaminopimelate epimerase
LVIHKMTGSGNDFVFVDGRLTAASRFSADLIRRLCARGTGVGADGLIVLDAGSRPGAVRFHFFNRDGQRAEMCGNGALCATRLAAWLGMAPAEGMVLETDAGPVEARCLDGPGERAELTMPSTESVYVPDIALADGERSLHATVVGVPHLIVLVDDVRNAPVLERGRELRSHPALGAAGANVNFVSAAGSDGWSIRTFERGVEDETLACGTGAVATAAALAAGGVIQLPWEVRTASGSVLGVAGDAAGRRRQISAPRLSGEGRLVFRAVLGC